MTRTVVVVTVLVVAAALSVRAQKGQKEEFVTRGIGVYPGDPREDFAPTFRIDATTYRNLAQLRPAFHSSAYDYNLTAQLVTDGIVETALPRYVVVASRQQGLISVESRSLPPALESSSPSLAGFSRQQAVWPKHKREWVMDGNWVTGFRLRGAQVWVQMELHGGAEPLAIDEVAIEGRVQPAGSGPENWTFTVMGSDDGKDWARLGQTSGMAKATGEIRPVVKLDAPSRHRYLRIVFDDPRAATWQVAEVNFSLGGHACPRRRSAPVLQRVEGRGPRRRVGLRGPGRSLHVRSRGPPLAGAAGRRRTAGVGRRGELARWCRRSPGRAADDDIRLPSPSSGRYVRVLLKKPATPEGYVLTEMEVFGRGGPVAVGKPRPPQRADGRADLAGGGWRLQRDSLVKAEGQALATPGFDDQGWVVATVPATILSSYWNAGALPDPNFGDNQLMISDAFFHADFWYRTEFEAPAAAPGRRRWLNFDGINLNADVFLNGEKLGRIEGGFARARFDVTSKLQAGAGQRARGASGEERRIQAASRRRPSSIRTRTAARSASTTRRITRRSGGTGFRRFAAATRASGTTCT